MQTKFIQEVVSPEVSNLKITLYPMNKKQGDQMQFALEKRLGKRERIHPTHHTSQWIVL